MARGVAQRQKMLERSSECYREPGRIEEGQGVSKNARVYWRELGRNGEVQDTFPIPYAIKP